MINNPAKLKPHINMMTKSPLQKQIIISMGSKNISKFIKYSGDHITNINHGLKEIKSDTFTDFIYVDYHSLIVTSNKVMFLLDLEVVESYIWNANLVNANDVQSVCLLQSKFYLKILGIPYLIEDTNTPINFSIMEIVIKSTHIFNNVCITSKLQVIKISLKSDITTV